MRNLLLYQLIKQQTIFLLFVKKYYLSRLLQEVGIPSANNPTYKLSDMEKESLIHTNILFCEKYKLAVSDDQMTLSIMY